MKRLILLKLIGAAVLCMSIQANAATVLISAEYAQDQTVPAGDYTFIVGGVAVGNGVITQTMRATLLNQAAGDYSAVIDVCNDAGCNSKSTSYTVPDVPNVDEITLTITVSRD